MTARIDFVNSDCYDLSCHTGTSFILDCLITEDCTGLPNDLTGYTARILVFETLESETIVEIPGVISAPEKGVIHFELTPTETGSLLVGEYNYHLELSIDDNIDRMSQGSFEVTQ